MLNYQELQPVIEKNLSPFNIPVAPGKLTEISCLLKGCSEKTIVST